MSINFLGNHKVIGAILAIIALMLVMYGYNRSKKKLQQPTQPSVHEQRQAMAAYTRPNIGKSSGCGCGKK